MKFNRKDFTQEQLSVIDNTERLNQTFENLLNVSSNDELNINRKKSLMFSLLITFMSQRKQDFLNVGIKPRIADSLVKNEIKVLNTTIKELKNVIQ